MKSVVALLVISLFAVSLVEKSFGCLPFFANDKDGLSGLISESQRCLNESLLDGRRDCSCSRPCSIFDTCCTDRFKNVSQSMLATLFSIPTNAVKTALADRMSVKCVQPSEIDRGQLELSEKIRFSHSVLPFFHAPFCEDENNSRKGDVSLLKNNWPIVETRTGVVFNSAIDIRCIGRKMKRSASGNSPFGTHPRFEYWPSFRIICDGRTQFGRTSFDPFNANDSKVFSEATDCHIELYQPNNSTFTSIVAFCKLPSRNVFLDDPESSAEKSSEKTNNQENCKNSSANQFTVGVNSSTKKGKGRNLMSFRLLMDFNMELSDDETYDFSEEEIPMMQLFYRYAMLSCLSLSIVSLAVMLFIYSLFRPLRNLPGKLTMCLSSALLVALLGYTIGVLGIPRIWYPMCFSIGITIHYCFLVSFFFGSCLAFDIWRTFYKECCDTSSFSLSEGVDKLFIRYNAFSWGVPTLIIILAVCVEFCLPLQEVLPRPRYSLPETSSMRRLSDSNLSTILPLNNNGTTLIASPNHDPDNKAVWVCWMMNRTAVMAYFNVPIGICLIASIVFFVWTIYLIARASVHSVKVAKNQAVNLRRRLVIYLKLSTIMGLTWLFGLIAALAQAEILWLFYALANALQGFYICLSFVCTKRVIRMLRIWLGGGGRMDRRRSSTSAAMYSQMSQRRSLTKSAYENVSTSNLTKLRNNKESTNTINNNNNSSCAVAELYALRPNDSTVM